MIMNATVIQVDPQGLMVRNEETGEEVMVFYDNSNMFSIGDHIRITFNGQMTLSIPPQITATSIQTLSSTQPAPPAPSEMRAVVLQKGNNILMVWNIRDRQRVRVEYPYAHHFCVQQHVIVQYDTLTLTNPPTVTATDVIPVCY